MLRKVSYFAHITEHTLNLVTSIWPREHITFINLDQGGSSLPPQHIHLKTSVLPHPRSNNSFMGVGGGGGGDGFLFTPCSPYALSMTPYWQNIGAVGDIIVIKNHIHFGAVTGGTAYMNTCKATATCYLTHMSQGGKEDHSWSKLPIICPLEHMDVTKYTGVNLYICKTGEIKK